MIEDRRLSRRGRTAHMPQRTVVGIQIEYAQCFNGTMPRIRRKPILRSDGSIADEHQIIVRIIDIRLQQVRMVVSAATVLVFTAGVLPVA